MLHLLLDVCSSVVNASSFVFDVRGHFSLRQIGIKNVRQGFDTFMNVVMMHDMLDAEKSEIFMYVFIFIEGLIKGLL